MAYRAIDRNKTQPDLLLKSKSSMHSGELLLSTTVAIFTAIHFQHASCSDDMATTTAGFFLCSRFSTCTTVDQGYHTRKLITLDE
jgi:hypothetical protein